MNNKSVKINCLEVELAIMRTFDIRRNLVVPNVTPMGSIVKFETDMLVITKSGYASGFEIKVSMSDLKADLQKTHIASIGKSAEAVRVFFGVFKTFSYVVTDKLEAQALTQIPYFCGLYVARRNIHTGRVYLDCSKQPLTLFNRKWNDREMYGVARLGAMRVYNLKQTVLNHRNGN